MIEDQDERRARMTRHRIVSASAVAALSLSMSGHLWAQQPPPGDPPPLFSISSDPKLLAPLPPPSAEMLKKFPPSTDPRNFEGTWLAERLTMRPPGSGPSIPYTDAAKQRMQQRAQRQREADAQGKVLLTDAGRCRPMGGMGIGADLFPAEIIQTPDKIVILNEEGRGRWIIHLNGEHPKNLKASHFGHSIGRWEGDTLVIDSVGLSAVTDGFVGAGMHSEKARIVSRLRKSDGGNTLELTSTIYDPETYTRPFEGRKTISHWHPELSVLEFQCEENMEGAREGIIE